MIDFPANKKRTRLHTQQSWKNDIVSLPKTTLELTSVVSIALHPMLSMWILLKPHPPYQHSLLWVPHHPPSNPSDWHCLNWSHKSQHLNNNFMRQTCLLPSELFFVELLLPCLKLQAVSKYFSILVIARNNIFVTAISLIWKMHRTLKWKRVLFS